MSGTNYSSLATAIGLDKLRAQYPALTGAGVTVGQAEAYVAGAGTFEVTPAAIGQPATNANDLITYVSGHLQTFTYNDGVVGRASSHATEVAQLFYGSVADNGAPEGVAPGVAHVDNYDANAYTPAGADAVVNLSFTSSADLGAAYNQAALANGTVFVAAAGDSGTPASPSTAYDVISVGASDPGAATAIGTGAKPDISAPGPNTSDAAPLVSGAAALLIQAAALGMGGTSTANKADARDVRTIKALLLNGASKPAGYFTDATKPTATDPLNGRYGSGILNVDQSVQELAAGEAAPAATGTAAIAAPTFSPSAAPPYAAALGWHLATLTAPVGHDATSDTIVTLSAGSAFVSTLTWAATAANTIDHLSLTLFDESTGLTVAQSAAAASTVQQVYFVAPASGTYALHVELTGSASAAVTETYALAYDGTLSPACFCAGTAIATEDGEHPVEVLTIGDRVRTASGALRPVRWIGRRSYAAALVAARPDLQPIRIRAGALGGGLPRRDLLVSADHALALDGLLIPARCLVNGGSIARERSAAAIAYHHIELDSHDVLLAEGAAAESFLDDGSRVRFHNAAEATSPAKPHPGYCAPRVEQGPALEALRRRLAGKADRLAA